jgi:dTMP kinase
VLDPGREALPAPAELLLMFAARAVHLANRIEPDLREGRWVLCDRFTDATYAYQGAGRGLSTAVIATLEGFVQGDRRPDLTILLDLPVAKALARVRLRNPGIAQDRFETEVAEFFERTRHAYLARAVAMPQRVVVVDADQPAADVTRAILAALEAKQWIS